MLLLTRRKSEQNLVTFHISIALSDVGGFKDLKSPIREGFVVDKVTPGQVFFFVLRFFHVIIRPPVLLGCVYSM
jgi:hypothetical protein